MYARILWMHDLSPRADLCLGPVLALTKVTGASVILAHSTGKDDPHPTQSAGDERVARARLHLERISRELDLEGISATVAIEGGLPEHCSRTLIERYEVDLLIAGRTGVSGLDRLLLGSTARRLVRTTTTPSIVVGARPFGALERVLVPVDIREPEATAGMTHAARLARVTGARLDFIVVIEAGSGAENSRKAQAQLERIVQGTLGAQMPGWTYRAVAAPSALHGILHVAKDHDLVVVSTAGRSGIERILMGSVAEELIRNCPVSVLVAR